MFNWQVVSGTNSNWARELEARVDRARDPPKTQIRTRYTMLGISSVSAQASPDVIISKLFSPASKPLQTSPKSLLSTPCAFNDDASSPAASSVYNSDCENLLQENAAEKQRPFRYSYLEESRGAGTGNEETRRRPLGEISLSSMPEHNNDGR
jgi:hypothetical protein